MGINDDLIAMDIDLLSEMFQSGDYEGLRDWVISHDKGLISSEIREQKAAFHTFRSDAIVACNDYLERSEGFYYGNAEVERHYRSRIREALEPLLLFAFIPEKTRRKMERSIDNRDVQKALRLIANLRWLSVGIEESARTSLQTKFKDPIKLLPEFLRILNARFAELRDNTGQSISSLITPLRKLSEDTKSDAREIQVAIDSVRNNVTLNTEAKERELNRYRDRLHDLRGIQSVVSQKLQEVAATATIARDFMANVKAFLNVIEDQLIWMKKRSGYVSTLSSLGESVEELQQTSEQLLENAKDEIGSIGKSVGARSNELQHSIQKIIEDQDALNRILYTDRPTLKAEIELAETEANENLKPIDFAPILKMIGEILNESGT